MPSSCLAAARPPRAACSPRCGARWARCGCRPHAISAAGAVQCTLLPPGVCKLLPVLLPGFCNHCWCCCHAPDSSSHCTTCRASLELPEARAGELARITELAGKAGVASLASLDAHIKLLQVGGGLKCCWW